MNLVNINTIKKSLPYLIIMFLVLGCSQTPRILYSVPNINFQYTSDNRDKKVKIGTVVGGNFTNDLEGSKIDALVFKAVLNESFKKYNLFTITTYNSDYILNATIMYQDQPYNGGLDLTVSLIVKYSLINQHSNEKIWEKDIISVFTAKFSDNFFFPERLSMANEGAIRNNIEILIKTLDSLLL